MYDLNVFLKKNWTPSALELKIGIFGIFGTKFRFHIGKGNKKYSLTRINEAFG